MKYVTLIGTCVSLILTQGSGKVLLPMLTEMMSFSKLENSEVDMKPGRQKEGKGVMDEQMDG